MFKIIQWNINSSKKPQSKPRKYDNMMFEFEVETHSINETKGNRKKMDLSYILN